MAGALRSTLTESVPQGIDTVSQWTPEPLPHAHVPENCEPQVRKVYGVRRAIAERPPNTFGFPLTRRWRVVTPAISHAPAPVTGSVPPRGSRAGSQSAAADHVPDRCGKPVMWHARHGAATGALAYQCTGIGPTQGSRCLLLMVNRSFDYPETLYCSQGCRFGGLLWRRR